MNSGPSDESIEVWARLLRTAQTGLAEVEAALKSANLPPLSWYDVLHELATAPKTGLRPFELVERMLLAQYNISRLLARMEDEGLVQLMACPDDGRGQVVRITQAGREARRRIWAVYGPAIEKQIGDKLTKSEALQLAKLLGKLNANRC